MINDYPSVYFGATYVNTDAHSYKAFNSLALSKSTIGTIISGISTSLYFLDEHLQLFKAKTKFINGINLPSDSKLKDIINKLINRNKFFKHNRIYLKIVLLADQAPELLIVVVPLAQSIWALNKKGFILSAEKSIRIHTQHSAFNPHQFTFSALNEFGFINDELLLEINEKNNISNTSYGCIFIKRDNHLFTPPQSDGALSFILKDKTIQICKEYLIVHSDLSFTATDIEKAEEIFICNDIAGIKWIVGYGEQRYFSSNTKKVQEKLMTMIN